MRKNQKKDKSEKLEEKTEKKRKKAIEKQQRKAIRKQSRVVKKENEAKEDREYREYVQAKKAYRKAHGLTLIQALKERKLIRWCSFKELMKYGLLTIVIIAALSGILEGFSILSTWIIKIVPALLTSHRVIVTSVIAAIGAVLAILCYIMSLSGDDVLKGFVASGSALFDGGTKDNGDRRVNAIMVVLTIAVFVLLAML